MNAVSEGWKLFFILVSLFIVILMPTYIKALKHNRRARYLHQALKREDSYSIDCLLRDNQDNKKFMEEALADITLYGKNLDPASEFKEELAYLGKKYQTQD
jgi:uncharacterized membrane protein YvbJ